MQMEYKLLCDKTGVILTRQPELVTDKLFITFTGAPEGATAVFERDDGNSMYRLIADEGKMLTDGEQKVRAIDIFAEDLGKWTEIDDGQ